MNQSHALVRSESTPAINTGGALAPIELSGSSNRQQQVGETAKHQLGQTADQIPLMVESSPINPLSQVLNTLGDELPVDGMPVAEVSLRSDVPKDSIFHEG